MLLGGRIRVVHRGCGGDYRDPAGDLGLGGDVLRLPSGNLFGSGGWRRFASVAVDCVGAVRAADRGVHDVCMVPGDFLFVFFSRQKYLWSRESKCKSN